MVGSFRSVILECIEQGALDTASFLAERLHAHEQSEASRHLVAKCLLLRGLHRCVYDMLRGCTSDDNRYVLALACVELRLWAEAETHLLQGGRTAGDWSTARVINGAYGLTLLGSVYRVLLQTERAVECYRAALCINPFMWSALEGLCALGVESDPSTLLTLRPEDGHTNTKGNATSSTIADYVLMTPSTPVTPTPMVGFAFQTAPASAAATAAVSSSAPFIEASSWLSRLQPLGRALWHARSYRGAEAMAALEQADARQRHGGWGLTLLATVRAEQGEYVEAVRDFDAARMAEPWRLEGAEVHSTALWHLKRDAQLSHLAHQCLRLSRTAPQTWCAVGNVMSLLREHDAAVRFFVRAQQLQPGFVYAYTLCGHEHVANDDLDQATTQFRNALQRDPRHYKAWYGLGMIYYRTQRFALAEYHFVQALRIHPRSSALHMYRGMVKNKLHEHDGALRCLEQALVCNPRNLLAKSLQCQVIIAQGQLDEGLAMVDRMLESAPREAFLHFLKASVCAKRGQRQLAIVHYALAQDLDSRNSSLIKSRIDRLQSGVNPLLADTDSAANEEPEDEFEVM